MERAGTPRAVRTVRGGVRVWFYVNEESIDFYVRPDKSKSGDKMIPAPVWFRMIWVTVYAFLAGFNCGQGKRFGLILFVIGAAGIWVWVQRMMPYAEGR